MVSVLHCKKIRLAVEDELSDAPTPLSYLDHEWVAGQCLHVYILNTCL